MMQGQLSPHSSESPTARWRGLLREKGVLLLFNPQSGGGNSLPQELISALEAAELPCTLRPLSPSSRMEELLADAENFAAVIAVGGDGTVGNCSYALRGRGVPLLPIPAGTANLIAQNLGVPDGISDQVRLLMQGPGLHLDLGEFESPSGERGGFALLMGAGADAEMIQTSAPLKKLFGPFAYFIAALRQIAPQSRKFFIQLDGGAPIESRCMCVMVANMGRANYRVPIAPSVSPCDGLLSVILVKEGNVFTFLPHVFDAVRSRLGLGDPLFGGNIEILLAREVRLWADEPLAVQHDGEMHSENLPFIARALPQAVPVFSRYSAAGINT